MSWSQCKDYSEKADPRFGGKQEELCKGCDSFYTPFITGCKCDEKKAKKDRMKFKDFIDSSEADDWLKEITKELRGDK